MSVWSLVWAALEKSWHLRATICCTHKLCCLVVVDWFHAVQAMISIGLIMLLISLSLIAIYMCVHTVSKNSTIIALVCFCLLSGKYFWLFSCHFTLRQVFSWTNARPILHLQSTIKMQPVPLQLATEYNTLILHLQQNTFDIIMCNCYSASANHQSMWAVQKICRSALNPIFVTSFHRLAP